MISPRSSGLGMIDLVSRNVQPRRHGSAAARPSDACALNDHLDDAPRAELKVPLSSNGASATKPCARALASSHAASTRWRARCAGAHARGERRGQGARHDTRRASRTWLSRARSVHGAQTGVRAHVTRTRE